MDTEDPDVEALRHPGHLLLDVPHHRLGHDPEVVGAVEAHLGSVGEDDLGLLLGAVQQDDPHLILFIIIIVIIIIMILTSLLGILLTS